MSPLVFAKELEKYLNPGSKILDAGCGAGYPIAKHLSNKFEVYGIDISKKQVELAKKLVPKAKFKKADLASPGFEKESFDGIICIYAIIHVNRKKHLEILKRFYNLLKSPGYLMICMGLDEFEGEGEFHGRKMYWSIYDKKTNIELLKKAGFEIIWKKEWSGPKDPQDRHLFVLCRK